MANKLVDATQLDADLTSIADAIREKGGTSGELSFPDDFVEAISGISGSNYPWLDETYAGKLDGYMPKVTHATSVGSEFIPLSQAISDAVNDGFSGDIYDLIEGKKTVGEQKEIEISEISAKMPVSEFVKLWVLDAVAKEYTGYIYETSKITDLGLVLLGDFSQGGSERGNTLSDSIENYSGVILQGIYKYTRTSNYNTSVLYQSIAYSQQYWAGMKDRNTTYRCRVTFTDSTHVDLDGNKQVLIYGIL